MGQFNTEQSRLMADRAFGAGQFNTEQNRKMADRNFNVGQFNTEQGRKMADRNQMMSQFNTEEDREAAVSARNIGQYNTQASRNMAAQRQNDDYGLSLLRAQQNAGDTQRDIQSQGIGADYAQFREERDYDRNSLLFQQSLLDGLPLETQPYTALQQRSGLQNLAGGALDLNSFFDELQGAGVNGSGASNSNAFDGATANGFQNLYQGFLDAGQSPQQAIASTNAQLGIG